MLDWQNMGRSRVDRCRHILRSTLSEKVKSTASDNGRQYADGGSLGPCK